MKKYELLDRILNLESTMNSRTRLPAKENPFYDNDFIPVNEAVQLILDYLCLEIEQIPKHQRYKLSRTEVEMSNE